MFEFNPTVIHTVGLVDRCLALFPLEKDISKELMPQFKEVQNRIAYAMGLCNMAIRERDIELINLLLPRLTKILNELCTLTKEPFPEGLGSYVSNLEVVKHTLEVGLVSGVFGPNQNKVLDSKLSLVEDLMKKTAS